MCSGLCGICPWHRHDQTTWPRGWLRKSNPPKTKVWTVWSAEITSHTTNFGAWSRRVGGIASNDWAGMVVPDSIRPGEAENILRHGPRIYSHAKDDYMHTYIVEWPRWAVWRGWRVRHGSDVMWWDLVRADKAWRGLTSKALYGPRSGNASMASITQTWVMFTRYGHVRAGHSKRRYLLEPLPINRGKGLPFLGKLVWTSRVWL